MINDNHSVLLNIQDLNITVVEPSNKITKNIRLLDNISFSLNAGQCLAIIGESGSGKSTISKALLGLCPEDFSVSGNVIYHNQNLLSLPANHKDWTSIRGRKIALIPQNSHNAFNPLLSISHQINETIKRHLSLTSMQWQQLMDESFSAVALPHYLQLLNQYPHELSGGTLQRICIALAFMLKPEIIIADEPTSSIDWLSKKEVLSFFKHALHTHHQAILMVSHDLADVKELADNIMILQNGKIIEHGTTNQVLHHPLHNYTKSLINFHKKLDTHFHYMLSQDSQNVNGQ